MIDIPTRVKDALRDGSMLKNYKFKVLNDDNTVDFIIDNDTLVSESVKINERMCTGNQLKFGLCEGSSLEFQYFDHPNITGRQIYASIEVQYKDSDGELAWHEIPMGFFTVDQCPMQFSTGIRKVTAYNKLRSKYLDQKANEMIKEIISAGEYGYTDRVSIYTILKDVLEDYGIEEKKIIASTATVSSFGGATLDTIPLCDSTGRSLGTNLYLYMSRSYYYLNSDDFYYFNLYAQELKQHCEDSVWGSYKNQYTTANGVVYTIEEYANQNYISSWRLCGQIYCRKKVDINTFFFQEKGGNPNITTQEYSECYSIDAEIPVHAEIGSTPPAVVTSVWKDYFNQVWGSDYVFADVFLEDLSESQKIRMTTEEIESISDEITLRELQSAVYETACQYGQLDRVTDLFSGVELNGSRLLPADDLYPANDLYPNGNSLRGNRSMYQKLWTDSQGVQSFRYLIITYKGLDEDDKEVEKVLQRTVNADGTTDYNMSDNWLFKNLVWSDADVGDYADAMVLKMQNISWFPFEMWCAGLPYLETGDELEITNSEGTYTSYVLQRQLNGIQNLQDTFIDGELDIF